jgi:hypothetical protein
VPWGPPDGPGPEAARGDCVGLIKDELSPGLELRVGHGKGNGQHKPEEREHGPGDRPRSLLAFVGERRLFAMPLADPIPRTRHEKERDEHQGRDEKKALIEKKIVRHGWHPFE